MRHATPQNLVTVDNALSLSAAARLAAVDGKAPDPSTVWRWAIKGVGGVRLGYARLGKRMVTSKPALEQFMRQLAEADRRDRHNPEPYFPTDAELEDELAAEGL